MARDFAAAIADFQRSFDDKVRIASIGAIQDLAAQANTSVGAGGNMPVDTGDLMGSIEGGVNGSKGTAVAAAMARFQAGDSAWIGWQMEYAAHVEFGSQGRSGRGYARKAAQNWKAIVRANAQKVAG